MPICCARRLTDRRGSKSEPDYLIRSPASRPFLPAASGPPAERHAAQGQAVGEHRRRHADVVAPWPGSGVQQDARVTCRRRVRTENRRPCPARGPVETRRRRGAPSGTRRRVTWVGLGLTGSYSVGPRSISPACRGDTPMLGIFFRKVWSEGLCRGTDGSRNLPTHFRKEERRTANRRPDRRGNPEGPQQRSGRTQRGLSSMRSSLLFIAFDRCSQGSTPAGQPARLTETT